MIRLVFSWNIKNDEEREYFEFIAQEFAPKIARMGIRLTEVWLTVYGSGPQAILPGVTTDRISLEVTMQSEEWLALTSRLQNYVTDYQCRIVD
jgi:hypothetical protein